MPRAKAKSYTNRTDLIGPPRLPNEQAPSQVYGQRAAQQAAQRAIPMAPTPVAAGPPPAPTQPSAASTPPAPPAAAPADLQAMLAQHISQSGAGRAGSFTRPTERPDEPVTAGLPVGPGPGPESLTGIGALARNNAVQQGTLTNLLQSMAASPTATSAIRDLAARAVTGRQ